MSSDLPDSPHRASFERFLQRDVAPQAREDVGLQGVFRTAFPACTGDGLAVLEFIEYELDAPKFDAAECLRRGLTFVAPLKAVVRLVLWEHDNGAKVIRDVKEQQLYFGEVPLLTDRDVFVVDGVERTARLALRQRPTASGGMRLGLLAAGDHLEEAAREGVAATLAKALGLMERAATRDALECLMPHDVVNARPLPSAFRKLLSKSPVVENLDATNPFSRVAHGWTLLLDDEARDALDAVETGFDLRPLAERITAGEGASLMRALPLAAPERPRDALPVARDIAERGGALVVAARAGRVHRANDRRVWVLEDGADAPTLYTLHPLGGPRVVTPLSLHPTVAQGARIEAGDVLAEGAAVVDGTLALGRDCDVSFSPACARGTCRVSKAGARALRSLRVERVDVEIRDTKLGCQEVTRDVPGATAHTLRHLDEAGIVTLGAEVEPGDALVGRVSPTETGALSDEAARASVHATVVGVEMFARRGRERDARHEAIVEAMKQDLRDAQEELAACLSALDANDDSLHGHYDELRYRIDRGDDLPPGVIRTVRIELLIARDVERGDELADGQGGRWVVGDVTDDVEADVELPGDGGAGVTYVMALRPEAKVVSKSKKPSKRRAGR